MVGKSVALHTEALTAVACGTLAGEALYDESDVRCTAGCCGRAVKRGAQRVRNALAQQRLKSSIDTVGPTTTYIALRRRDSKCVPNLEGGTRVETA